ncbi:MAG: SapC family protein [Gammaproteobacteria bacterium]|nr:SapC family protein [Gammaproteobacteria bacterium]NNF49813.1 SapC family protein [Woeseiaceae bacterium]MBT8094568.1 SapC family protein [Gammaproteobacteria bacterium]MBT8105167.1 SapC family protein [Gammaproteobacteria bacterium]NNK25181.1 SapC family protein [Woeseiaceae bacterium]
MNEKTKSNKSSSLSGKMFLYEQPELLSPEAHGTMGFTPADRPFEFVRHVRAVPLTMIEFGSAQRTYPIIFSELENPMPLAVVGLLDDVNLFVKDDGHWDEFAYLPTYLRCHPFTFAKEAGGQMAVVVDRSAASVSETPEYPFFNGNEPSEHTSALMELCTQFERERQRTVEYCRKLVELDLLATMRASHGSQGDADEKPLADYVAIDAQKLDDLPADAIYELHTSGFLSASYLHLYSLENWRHLMARRVAREAAA